MPALQVKDCPNDVYERLRVCATEENRSISQQTLTIIEEFLDMRERIKQEEKTLPTPNFVHKRSPYVEAHDGTDYIAKRKAVFERIEKLPPIPESETAPPTVELLAQIREEEAR